MPIQVAYLNYRTIDNERPRREASTVPKEFDTFSDARQERHIGIIIRHIVDMANKMEADATEAKPKSPLDRGAIEGECTVAKD